ncbi:hypothetical protein [Mycobacterium sp. 852002-40037_SCH5390672]|uniref:hypothetical protein n=1 Tax=Mycobacterium sp. 852002-40037_SCH5390672 TaxID=1834089 RepID=UPI0008049C26|nr:hypothetical protein [Mycobacterium sp. 852002-40037_SCH5390672]OBB96475.1 hypothetical protein A5782_04875 [Mycobacterium sp. 852002-40037_SCH5390672]
MRSHAKPFDSRETGDMVSYGALFLANPDLPQRLANGDPFNVPGRGTFSGRGERGNTDYPRLAHSSSDEPQLERHR